MVKKTLSNPQLIEDARLITRAIAYITIAARNLDKANVDEAPETLFELSMELSDLMDVVNNDIASRVDGENITQISDYLKND